jgi:hypothetical protein
MIECKSCNWKRNVPNREVAIQLGVKHTNRSGHFQFRYEYTPAMQDVTGEYKIKSPESPPEGPAAAPASNHPTAGAGGPHAGNDSP